MIWLVILRIPGYVSLKNAGFEVCPIIKGLGEYPGIRRMYVEHAQKAIDSMK